VSLVTVVAGKGAPGVTTSLLALALGWPGPVLVADTDPAGGDIAVGWLGGRVGLDRGLLSWAAATRHAQTGTVADLAPHVTAVPETGGRVLVLPGLAHAGQAAGLDQRTWARLAATADQPWPTDPRPDPGPGELARGNGPGSAADAGADASGIRVDVLADCGRLGPDTPWPLLTAAAVVLLVTRPTLRGVQHAHQALQLLDTAAFPAASHAAAADSAGAGGGRVGLVVCGPGPYEPGEVGRVLRLPVRAVLPADPRAAAVLSDGAPAGRGWPRTPLARAAATAARRLASTLAAPTAAPTAASPAASAAFTFTARTNQ
jgi:hypothetical protein